MRTFLLSLTLTAALILSAACGSSEQANTSAGNSAPTQTGNTRTTTTTTQPAADGPPVATSHGTPPAQSGSGGAGPDGGPANPALDAKIEQAEARAKAAGATPADKQAAAAAYLERANLFYLAGNPMLYKFALRDFRRTLKYDPTNKEALARRDQIIDIYINSVRRPVPELGNEP